MPKREDTTRLCCVTREEKPIAELIRFVVGPDETLVPDVDGKAEGRGVWVTATADMVREAVKKKAFAKSLKQELRVPDSLADLTRLRLEQRLLGALNMARKAGQFVTGATKVRAAIGQGDVIALLTATDAAADGRSKMLGALKASPNGTDVPHLEILGSEQLGLALGLENVIHAALTKGPAANSALERAEKLARFGA